MLKLIKRISFVFILALLALRTVEAQTTQTDFDNDGVSEYVLVSIQQNQALNWSYTSALTGISSTLGSIGSTGDHLIIAPWKGLSSPQIGVVSLDDTSGALLWKIINDQSTMEERELGSDGDTAISGADFNGNGKADAAVARLKKGRVEWSISYDMFDRAVGQENPSTMRFGVAGDRIFFASPDGAFDWLGVAGKNKKGRSQIKLKNPLTGESRTISKFPGFISKGARPRPFPVRQASGIDVLGFTKKKAGNTEVHFHNFDGSRIAIGTLPGTGDVIVGNFTSSPGEEVAIKTSAGFTTYNAFDGQSSSVATADGIPTDHININTLRSESGGGDDDDDDDDSGGGGGPSDVASCNSISSWPSSHIYKTIGSHHFTDIRRNTIGLILKPGTRGPFPNCISMVDRNGKVAAYLGLYATGNGWAARYYAGIGCGSSTAYNGATVARNAERSSGSPNVYANFGGKCYGPINANRCIGSSQC
ncbi:MAG: hypothetical protein J5J00_04430 [Deltaproteobacteria bacterium]|nr:hypothetical protein [Deltaproteobacteria bacterium]